MEINAGSYVYSTSRLNCNSWWIWFRTAISLKFDSFLHCFEPKYDLTIFH